MTKHTRIHFHRPQINCKTLLIQHSLLNCYCAGSQCFLKCVRTAARCCLGFGQPYFPSCLPSWSCVRTMMHRRMAKTFVSHKEQNHQQIEFAPEQLIGGVPHYIPKCLRRAVGCCVHLLASLPRFRASCLLSRLPDSCCIRPLANVFASSSLLHVPWFLSSFDLITPCPRTRPFNGLCN